MEFEFDRAKSVANMAKHGIDFIEAQALWLDDGLIDAPVPSDGEPRFLAIGRLRGRYWTAVCTLWGGAVRIISVRRARKEEISYYEGT
jgi:uncharacterized protein